MVPDDKMLEARRRSVAAWEDGTKQLLVIGTAITIVMTLQQPGLAADHVQFNRDVRPSSPSTAGSATVRRRSLARPDCAWMSGRI